MTLKNRIKQVYGFSLLELVVVLAVTASMSVAILPSFVKHAEHRVADNHIGAVLTIHDALKTYYNARLAEGVPTGTSTLFPNGCTTLVNEGILPQIPPNVWGGTFSCSMRSIDNDPYANILHKMALLEVTDVPLEMANYLTAHLPLTSCVGSTCTSSILPPNTQALPVRGCTIPYAANYDPNASVNHDDCVCYNMKFKECGSSKNLGIGLNHICKKIDGVPVTPADLGRIVDVNSVMHWSSSPSLWEVSEVWEVPFILAYNGGTGNYMNNFDSYPAYDCEANGQCGGTVCNSDSCSPPSYDCEANGQCGGTVCSSDSCSSPSGCPQ